MKEPTKISTNLDNQLKMIDYLLKQNNREIASKAIKDAFDIYLKDGIDNESIRNCDDFETIYSYFLNKYKPIGLNKKCIEQLKENSAQNINEDYDKLIMLVNTPYNYLSIHTKTNIVPPASETLRIRELLIEKTSKNSGAKKTLNQPQKEMSESELAHEQVMKFFNINAQGSIQESTEDNNCNALENNAFFREMLLEVKKDFEEETQSLNLKQHKYPIYIKDVNSIEEYYEKYEKLERFNFVKISFFILLLIEIIVVITFDLENFVASDEHFLFLLSNPFLKTTSKIILGTANFYTLLINPIIFPFKLLITSKLPLVLCEVAWIYILTSVLFIITGHQSRVLTKNGIIDHFCNYRKHYKILPPFLIWIGRGIEDLFYPSGFYIAWFLANILPLVFYLFGNDFYILLSFIFCCIFFWNAFKKIIKKN